MTQDQDYWDMTTAVQMVYPLRLGVASVSASCRSRQIGDCCRPASSLRLRGRWTSLPDLQGWPLRMANFVSRRELLNAYQMRPADIVDLLRKLDANPPRLIVSYAQAAYEIAHFTRE